MVEKRGYGEFSSLLQPQQDFFLIRSVTKCSPARFSHENLVKKVEIFVQDFAPIRLPKIFPTRFFSLFMGKNVAYKISQDFQMAANEVK